MKKVEMIDYVGDSDEKGNPIGHPIKVLLEYSSMLSDKFELSYSLPKKYLEKSNKKGTELPYFADRTQRGILNLFKTYLREYINLNVAWKNAEANVLWYFNTDYVLYLFLITKKKGNRKIICSTYVDNNHCQKKWKIIIKQFLYTLAKKRVDSFISSNYDFQCKGVDIHFIPDYFYDKTKYLNYKNEKEDFIVCLGTMAEQQKDLESAVKFLNNTNYKVIIKGKFHDRNYFNKISSIIGENIELEDKYLSEREYLELLSKAKYSLLPYRKEAYSFKTSGVLLESIFLNAIPITPATILEKNRLKGIGYNSLKEIETIDFANFDRKEYLAFYDKLKNSKYSYDKVKDEIIKALEGE